VFAAEEADSGNTVQTESVSEPLSDDDAGAAGMEKDSAVIGNTNDAEKAEEEEPIKKQTETESEKQGDEESEVLQEEAVDAVNTPDAKHSDEEEIVEEESVIIEEGKESKNAIAVTTDEDSGIQYVTKTDEMIVGKTRALPIMKKNDKIGTYTITWESSDKNVISISADGTMKALKPGHSTVTGTAHVNGKDYRYEDSQFTVFGIATDFELQNIKLDIREQNSVEIKTVPSPAIINDIRIDTWGNCASVTPYLDRLVGSQRAGIICVGKEDGIEKVDVTIISGEKEITKSFYIESGNARPDSLISIEEKTATIYKGTTKNLRMRCLSGTIPISFNDIVWKSSNPKVATVSSTGNVTAIGNGTAKITAAYRDYPAISSSCKVTVGTKADRIALNRTSAKLLKGKSVLLTANVLPSSASNKSVTWKSSNTKVAKVNTKGQVTATGKGSAVITCKAMDGSGKTATCKISVTIPVSKITLSKTKATLKKGKSFTLKKTIYPSNADNKAVVWKSSNTKVATVTQAGKVTAKAKGKAVISCTAKDGSGAKVVCVVTCN
jgi:uncharacterized protein YjdB